MPGSGVQGTLGLLFPQTCRGSPEKQKYKFPTLSSIMGKAAVTYRVKAKFYKMGKVIMMRSLTSFFYKCQFLSKRELLQSAELSLLIA